MASFPFIMLCQQSWALPLGTNARSLARELARHHRVLYVQMPLDLHHALRELRQGRGRALLARLRDKTPALCQPEPNVWVLSPEGLALSASWLPWTGLFRIINRRNARQLAGSIRRAARQLGLENPTLLVDGLIYQATELKALLQPARLVYYLRDYMLAVPYFRRHGPAAEARLLGQADVVAANSAYLADYARRVNSNSHDIGQGCELTRYRPNPRTPEPADLTAVPHPRIGYTGFLTSLRLDLDLLEQLARQRPAWHLVLVGPEDADFRASVLHRLPNVHFLGNKQPAELPAYVQHLDVCINPQLDNATTAGNYPLKIDEYLAMGKPVVATHTRAMDLFADHVVLARDPASWLAALSAALSTEAEEAAASAAWGRAFALSHTWAASADKLYAALAATPAAPAAAPKAVIAPGFNAAAADTLTLQPAVHVR